jgi:hypothetical protein
MLTQGTRRLRSLIDSLNMTGRRPAFVRTTVAAILTVGVALCAAAPPAVAVPGLQTVESGLSADNSQSPKTKVAYCPANKRLIGGGGSIQGTNAALTQLRPVRRLGGGGRDGYVVTGARATPGSTAAWSVQAYAMCANPLTGLHVVSAKTDPSSLSKQATAAACPGGERAIGTGARISTLGGRVVLQVARPSHSGDIARVQGHEGANGYSGVWWATAYAICVNPPVGYQVAFGQSSQSGSESQKFAFARCEGNRQRHSSGAAVSSLAPGNIALIGVFDPDPQLSQAHAIETTPTDLDWDFAVATAVCAF